MYLHLELQVQLEMTEGFKVMNINVELFESLWISVLTSKAKSHSQQIHFLAGSALLK